MYCRVFFRKPAAAGATDQQPNEIFVKVAIKSETAKRLHLAEQNHWTHLEEQAATDWHAVKIAAHVLDHNKTARVCALEDADDELRAQVHLKVTEKWYEGDSRGALLLLRSKGILESSAKTTQLTVDKFVTNENESSLRSDQANSVLQQARRATGIKVALGELVHEVGQLQAGKAGGVSPWRNGYVQAFFYAAEARDANVKWANLWVDGSLAEDSAVGRRLVRGAPLDKDGTACAVRPLLIGEPLLTLCARALRRRVSKTLGAKLLQSDQFGC